MEQIIQLKAMRDDALVRLQSNPDFKLVNSLDALIKDLEVVSAQIEISGEEIPAESSPVENVDDPIVDEKPEVETEVAPDFDMPHDEVDDLQPFDMAGNNSFDDKIKQLEEVIAESSSDTSSDQPEEIDETADLQSAPENVTTKTESNTADDQVTTVEALEAELSGNGEDQSDQLHAQPGSMIN